MSTSYTSTYNLSSRADIKDKNLIQRSFRLMGSRGTDNVSLYDNFRWGRYYNFYTTALGDNLCVNPLHQYSPATDPRPERYIKSKEGGMGIMYKPVIEDNSSYLTLTAGVAEFPGLVQFIFNMFDPVGAVIANKGRTPGFAYYAGQVLGTISFWPMQLLSIGINSLNFMMDVPPNQFYSIKQTMGIYHRAVQHMVSDIMVNLGFITPVMPSKDYSAFGEDNYGVPKDVWNIESQISMMNALFGSAINEDGSIDVVKVLNKGTRKYRYLLDQIKSIENELGADGSAVTPAEKYKAIRKKIETMTFPDSIVEGIGYGLKDFVDLESSTTGKIRDGGGDSSSSSTTSGLTDKTSNTINVLGNEANTPEVYSSFLDQDVFNSSTTQGAGANNLVTETGYDTSGTFNTTVSDAAISSSALGSKLKGYYTDSADTDGWFGTIGSLIKTGWSGGYDALTYKVEHMGAVTDSFSNGATESPIADKFNSAVKAANDLKFDIAGGTTGIAPVDAIINTIKDGVMGIANSMRISAIPLMLTNNSYVKIPKHWSESSTSLHKESYRIKFVAPYAHPYCQITSIWIPLCTLLPMIFPNAAGPSTYTTPFLVKAFSQGRQIIRTGMVESATITFGDGPAGWTKDRKPLNCTVDLNIIDLEELVAFPVNRALSPLDLTNPADFFKKVLHDNGKYTDWLARVTGTSYLDTMLKYSKLNRRITASWQDIKYSVSGSNFGNMFNDSIVQDIGYMFNDPLQR